MGGLRGRLPPPPPPPPALSSTACGPHRRQPAILAAFAALAKHRDTISSGVKVTAFADLGAPQAPADPTAVDLLAFPAGLCFSQLPVASIADAVLLAAAEDPVALSIPRDSPALKCMVRAGRAGRVHGTAGRH